MRLFQSGTVDLLRLQKAFTEWTCLKFELQGLQGSDYMECEACGTEPRCIHLDGNAKLYRYRSSGSSEVSSAYHQGTFIADKTAVDAHMAKLKTEKDQQPLWGVTVDCRTEQH